MKTSSSWSVHAGTTAATTHAASDRSLGPHSRGGPGPRAPGSFRGLLYRVATGRPNGPAALRNVLKPRPRPARRKKDSAGMGDGFSDFDEGDECAEGELDGVAGPTVALGFSGSHGDAREDDNGGERRSEAGQASASPCLARLAPSRSPRDGTARRMAAAGWPGAAILFDPRQSDAATPGDRLRAMAALLLHSARARPSESAGSFAAALLSVLRGQTSHETTLAEVRELLISESRGRGRDEPAKRAAEATQVANLLLPLQLLVTSLPRTVRQREIAMGRLELAEGLVRSPLALPRETGKSRK